LFVASHEFAGSISKGVTLRKNGLAMEIAVQVIIELLDRSIAAVGFLADCLQDNVV
jgi:hypothetical protein